MFSGIIERVGQVGSAAPEGGSLAVTIETTFNNLSPGESVAVNGVCLTVIRHESDGLADFFVSRETLTRSNLGGLQGGMRVNLERAVTLNSRLSGHLVQGHVDGLATLISAVPSDGAHELVLEMSDSMGRYCVEKGSLAVNGISLTINKVEDMPDQRTRIHIAIIPHTWEHTNLCDVGIGGPVNIEVDAIAKLVERLCHPYHRH